MAKKYRPFNEGNVRSGRGWGYWKYHFKEGENKLGPFFVPGCFIATAVYGTPLAPEIDILRDFRDKFLTKNKLGNKFVGSYYQYSPPIANFISKHFLLRIILRKAIIKPIVEVVKFLIG